MLKNAYLLAKIGADTAEKQLEIINKIRPKSELEETQLGADEVAEIPREHERGGAQVAALAAEAGLEAGAELDLEAPPVGERRQGLGPIFFVTPSFFQKDTVKL